MSTERTCMALLMFSPHVAAALVWLWLARRDVAKTESTDHHQQAKANQ